VQNKLHWAITGQTAAEIIAGRADCQEAEYGLTTWRNAPAGHITKSDVTVAKELPCREGDQGAGADRRHVSRLRRKSGRPRIGMRMKDWAEKLDGFLQFNEYEILTKPRICSHVSRQSARGRRIREIPRGPGPQFRQRLLSGK